MASKFVTTIDRSGPFFVKDVKRTLRQNIQDLMDAIEREGQADVQAQLRAGEGARQPLGGGIAPARVSGHVVGRTHNLAGKRWAVTAVVSVTHGGLLRRQAIKLNAAGSRLEGRDHAFRRTTQRLKRARAMNTVELLKGLR